MKKNISVNLMILQDLQHSIPQVIMKYPKFLFLYSLNFRLYWLIEFDSSDDEEAAINREKNKLYELDTTIVDTLEIASCAPAKNQRKNMRKMIKPLLAKAAKIQGKIREMSTTIP